MLDERSAGEFRPCPEVVGIIPDGKGGIQPEVPSDDLRESIIDWQVTRERRALELAPQREEGLDVASVGRFIMEKGLRPRPAVIMYPEDVPGFRLDIERAGYSSEPLATLDTRNSAGGETVGSYVREFGMVVVLRDRFREADNGTALTLATLVHEQAHSSAVNSRDMVYLRSGSTVEIFMSSCGFAYDQRGLGEIISREGIFFEEGFAELIKAEYVAKELGMPNGIRQNGPMTELDTGDSIPSVYTWHAPDPDHTTYSISAFPAYGLELLMREQPSLYHALLKSRNRHEVANEVFTGVDRAQPALSAELQQLQYTGRDFQAGLHLVQLALLPER